MICAVLGAGAILPALGVINFAIPALAHAYQGGDAGTMTIADGFFTWPGGAMTYPAVLFPIGTLLFAVAIWRCRALPRGAVVGFVLANLLIAMPVHLHSVRLAGGVLSLAIGAWIAADVWRHTATPLTPQ
jgi:hypothetical protein